MVQRRNGSKVKRYDGMTMRGKWLRPRTEERGAKSMGRGAHGSGLRAESGERRAETKS